MNEWEQAAAYDAVAYPTGVFRVTHPDRMAVTARLQGLAPPPIETARVLEIGGGDGGNLIGLAGAFPDARFVDFDIAPSAVARGQAWVQGARLDNIELRVMDLLDATEALDGPFDYIIAHGVYAWVPDAVRAAVMPLIGRLLSAHGVAVVSYNVLPGAHVRLALRALMLREMKGKGDVAAQIAAAKAVLTDFAAPREGDPPFVAAMRVEALSVARRANPVLWHDELNAAYHPQAIGDVADAAAAAGLQYLGEADHGSVEDGFLADDAPDRSAAAVVRALQASDYTTARLFRHSLFVRADAAPGRQLTSAPLIDLHVAIKGERTGPLSFAQDKVTFEVTEAAIADGIERAMALYPAYLPVRGNFEGKPALDVLFRLFQPGLAELSTAPVAITRTPGARAVASRVARAMIACGSDRLVTLDQRCLAFEDAGARALVMLCDGTRARAQLAAEWAAAVGPQPVGIEDALASFAAVGLIER